MTLTKIVVLGGIYGSTALRMDCVVGPPSPGLGPPSLGFGNRLGHKAAGKRPFISVDDQETNNLSENSRNSKQLRIDVFRSTNDETDDSEMGSPPECSETGSPPECIQHQRNFTASSSSHSVTDSQTQTDSISSTDRQTQTDSCLNKLKTLTCEVPIIPDDNKLQPASLSDSRRESGEYFWPSTASPTPGPPSPVSDKFKRKSRPSQKWNIPSGEDLQSSVRSEHFQSGYDPSSSSVTPSSASVAPSSSSGTPGGSSATPRDSEFSPASSANESALSEAQWDSSVGSASPSQIDPSPSQITPPYTPPTPIIVGQCHETMTACGIDMNPEWHSECSGSMNPSSLQYGGLDNVNPRTAVRSVKRTNSFLNLLI